MLDAGQRAARGAQGRVVRVPVGLVERDAAVAVGIRGAEQAGDQRVGEEAAFDLVGLLAVL